MSTNIKILWSIVIISIPLIANAIIFIAPLKSELKAEKEIRIMADESQAKLAQFRYETLNRSITEVQKDVKILINRD